MNSKEMTRTEAQTFMYERVYGRENKIERAKLKLETNGVVPLDEIFELVGEGINFRDLDNKYNKHNKTYVDYPSP